MTFPVEWNSLCPDFPLKADYVRGALCVGAMCGRKQQVSCCFFRDEGGAFRLDSLGLAWPILIQMDPGNLRGDRWVKWKGMILLGTGAWQLAISLQFCVTDSPLITVKTLFVCSTSAALPLPPMVLSNPLSFIWLNYGSASPRNTQLFEKRKKKTRGLSTITSSPVSSGRVNFYECVLKVLTPLSGMGG